MHHHTHAHSRRDFFSKAFGGALAGASIIEEAFLRATWARAQAPSASTSLFTIEKVAEGVYAALARPQIMTNCNAAIFVNARDVLVVDAHSKPSASAALIAQIKKEVTTKPVRYLVNSHFHWDHTQGDQTYKAAGANVDIIASDTTKQLMAQLSRNRLKESLDGIPRQIDDLKARLAKPGTAADQERYSDLIRQLEAYQTEMKNVTLELPTITFAKSHVIQDSEGDLHLEFHGRAHTAGDIVVFSPRKRVVASGDAIIGFLPNIADGYPRPWPATINSVGQLAFDHIIAGHGPVHHDRARMTQMRNYIEELTGRVEQGKKAGRTLAELQSAITPASLKSLQANGYGSYVADNMDRFTVYLGQRTALEDRLSANVEATYKNLDRA
ncbi:MAG: MBL fold metallo-hydrolase [Bryobacteraceae bacterium]|jgi:glyoxylase-like metal-dependent hydrolase (beta-lactamase superfamily II)